jgi:hypothetical protein
MEIQPTPEPKKNFLQNDRLLVCGMLVIYGVCIVGLIGTGFLAVSLTKQAASASATNTAVAFSTHEAEISATASALSTEQAQYDFIDPFDKNLYYWGEGSESDDYSDDHKEISGGVYTWKIDTLRKSHVSWEEFYQSVYSSNYDVYVDTRIVEGNRGEVCSGLLFGMSSSGFDGGVYVFVVCNDKTYYLSYYTEKDDWQDLVSRQYHPAIRMGDWNRLEVSSRAASFTLFINNEVVFKTTDHQYAKGDLAVIIDVDGAPAEIQFDNFGYQRR